MGLYTFSPLVTFGDNMDDTEFEALVARVIGALRDQEAQQQTEATVPAHVGTCVVAFADEHTEATAQRIYAYMRVSPDATTAQIVEGCELPTHWFRNPKRLANGTRITPGRAWMQARAGVSTPATSTPKPDEATPEQAQALRAVAVRVAEHLEHALDDGLASGLLYEKAKSTRTLRNLATTVRARVGL